MDCSLRLYGSQLPAAADCGGCGVHTNLTALNTSLTLWQAEGPVSSLPQLGLTKGSLMPLGCNGKSLPISACTLSSASIYLNLLHRCLSQPWIRPTCMLRVECLVRFSRLAAEIFTGRVCLLRASRGGPWPCAVHVSVVHVCVVTWFELYRAVPHKMLDLGIAPCLASAAAVKDAHVRLSQLG